MCYLWVKQENKQVFFGDYICHQKKSYILSSLPLDDGNLSSFKRKTPAIKKMSFIFWQLKTKLVQLECYRLFFFNAMILSSCEWEHVQSCIKHEVPTTPGPFFPWVTDLSSPILLGVEAMIPRVVLFSSLFSYPTWDPSFLWNLH